MVALQNHHCSSWKRMFGTSTRRNCHETKAGACTETLEKFWRSSWVLDAALSKKCRSLVRKPVLIINGRTRDNAKRRRMARAFRDEAGRRAGGTTSPSTTRAVRFQRSVLTSRSDLAFISVVLPRHKLGSR